MLIIKLEQNEDGSYTAVYDWRTYRFLMGDGTTIDVRAISDDSVLRTKLVAMTKSRRIEGVAQLKDPEPEVVPTKRVPTKRVPTKKIGQQRAS